MKLILINEIAELLHYSCRLDPTSKYWYANKTKVEGDTIIVYLLKPIPKRGRHSSHMPDEWHGYKIKTKLIGE